MTTHAKRPFVQTRLRLIYGLFLVAASALGPAKIGAAETTNENRRTDLPCNPSSLLTEFFDSVTPPALPVGWSSMTWVTSNSGVPTPPADTLPNAAFVDDPATITDKQLFSPSITLACDQGGVGISFRNNFNFQDGFDGGVLEVSYDGGAFQDVLAAGGTFVRGGYNGTINSCCGNPLAGRPAWTGNSAGFIDTTVVNLPGGCITLNHLVVRWRMGSDSSVSGEGWRIDNVHIVGCPRPIRRSPHPRPRPTPR
jgi:hypothetical protein